MNEKNTTLSTNVIKVRFLREGVPSGKEYTYYTSDEVAVDDTVEIDTKNGISNAIVTQVNVPEEEIAAFKDAAKTIRGKVKEPVPLNEIKE